MRKAKTVRRTVRLTAELSLVLGVKAAGGCNLQEYTALTLEALSDAARCEQRLYRNMLLRWTPPRVRLVDDWAIVVMPRANYEYLNRWARSMGKSFHVFFRLALFAN